MSTTTIAPAAFQAPPADADLCTSRGPRIGEDGKPICGLVKFHTEQHWANPEDGWGDWMRWTDTSYAGVPNADNARH